MKNNEAALVPEDPRPTHVYNVHLRLICRLKASSEKEAIDFAMEAAAWMGDDTLDPNEHDFYVPESECIACHRLPELEETPRAGAINDVFQEE